MIVMMLIGLMALILVMALNPGVIVDKGNDSQRKKDLGRIRIAFEEYFNDKKCYPSQVLIDGLECEKNGFKPWLSNWPCDPNGQKYYVMTDDSSCPRSYRILTNLKNRQDPVIPSGWYSQNSSSKFGDGTVTINDVNYGISSQNVSWYEEMVPPHCYTSFKGCYLIPGLGRCNALPPGEQHVGAYLHPDCMPECQVSCCEDGQICVLP